MLHGLCENTRWIPSLFPWVMYHFPSLTVSNADRESRGEALIGEGFIFCHEIY